MNTSSKTISSDPSRLARYVVPAAIMVRRIAQALSQRNAQSTLRKGEVYAIALRHLEEGLRSRNAEVLAGIEREVSCCENASVKSRKNELA